MIIIKFSKEQNKKARDSVKFWRTLLSKTAAALMKIVAKSLTLVLTEATFGSDIFYELFEMQKKHQKSNLFIWNEKHCKSLIS